MKISYNWLKDFVDFDWTPEELDEKLTDTGLEVEGVEEFVSLPGGLEGVVVGHVVELVSHPNADKLRLCTVDVGADEHLSIVCGAPNVAQGQKVPVATVGATLYPLEGDPFTIKKSKIRGELSQGMICAEDELGLGSDHDGIIVLDPATVPGTPAAEVFNIEKDYVLEIGLTANRADAASHFGAARDLAALKRVKAKFPPISDAAKNANGANPFSIEIQDQEKCPRYAGVYIAGVSVKPSPEWLQNRLKAIGLRPKNNLVDITNYVLHELGQPMHAFDADVLRGNKIVVKTMPKDQKFTTLDDVERDIVAGRDLMICDAEGPVAIAGVIGGQNSMVTETTKNVFLEIAYFNPVTTRKTAKAFGLKTDASYRFERGIDPNNTLNAALRAVSLILELAGGEASPIDDVKLQEFPPFQIEYDIAKANQMMGRDFSVQEITDILNALDIEVKAGKDDNTLELAVPPYRVDVTRPQDVMEEILRIFGYNNIEFTSRGTISFSLSSGRDPWKVRETWFNYLAGNGWNEIITNSLISQTYAKDHTVNLLNNLSEELAVMRDNMLVTGLDVLEFNHNRKATDLRMFEFGRIYWKDENGAYKEKEQVAMYLTGNTVQAHWRGKAHKGDLFALTREMERLQQWFGFTGEIEELEETYFWDYGLALMKNKKVIARWGKVKDEFLTGKKLQGEVFFALIEWESLFKLYNKLRVEFKELPKFPAVDRDISMLVPDSLRYEEIRTAILKANPKLIRSVTITDVYRGDKIGKDQKSYLVNLTLLDDAKTLTDKAVDKVMGRVFHILENDLKVEVRK